MNVSGKQDFLIFQLKKDLSGEYQKSNDPSQIFQDDKVHIIANHALRKIFICLGPRANVRARFAGAFAARSIRQERKLNYHVETVDEVKDGLIEELLSNISPQESYLKSKTTVRQELKQTGKSEGEITTIPSAKLTPKPVEEKPASKMLIGEQDMQLFQLVDDTFVEYQTHANPAEFLKKEKVIILINNILKKIYLWIGSTVNVNARFNGAFTSQSMQRNCGIEYRVVTIEEGHESDDFHSSLSQLANPRK